MGSLIHVTNPGVPMAAKDCRRRRWLHLGESVRFLSGLVLTAQRINDDDGARLVLLASLHGSQYTLDAFVRPSFVVAHECLLVIRAVALARGKPSAVLLEVQASRAVINAAMEMVA